MVLEQKERIRETENQFRCAEHRQKSHLACGLWECRYGNQKNINPIWNSQVCGTCLHLPKDEGAEQDLDDLNYAMELYHWGQERP